MPANLANRSQQFREAPLPFRVAVRIYILAEQLNLGVARIRHAPRLGQHRRRRPAALFAARVRNHAVRAELVAAFDDRDVAAMRIRPRRELRLECLLGLAVVESGNALGSLLQLHQHLRQPVIRGRSRNDRYIRSALKDALALLLRDTAQHREALALLVQRLVVVEPVENLLLRLVANRAGVVEDQVGRLFRLDARVALVLQRPDDLFRVMDVHLAAEGFDIEGSPARSLLQFLGGRVGRYEKLPYSNLSIPP